MKSKTTGKKEWPNEGTEIQHNDICTIVPLIWTQNNYKLSTLIKLGKLQEKLNPPHKEVCISSLSIVFNLVPKKN